MLGEITPVPEIPQVLVDAAFYNNLVPFIGAGVSRLGGCPDWNGFAEAALKSFVGQEKLNHAEIDQIRNLSPRVKLSIAVQLEKKQGKEIAFEELLQVDGDEEKKKCSDVYKYIGKLSKVFVTTNYDKWLDKLLLQTYRSGEDAEKEACDPKRTKIFWKYHDLSVENLGRTNSIFHIHGSVAERSSMVLTTQDYLNRYSSHRLDGENRENSFLSFLDHLFRTRNVLFIGYGLEEIEVLEYVIQKGTSQNSKGFESPRHYVLQGFFSYQKDLARKLEEYFYEFGIGLLPFSRDERNWDQLIKVLETFAKKIIPGPELGITMEDEMKALLP